ncbi:hypothetical protein FSP39_023963 [Pinctada imbricata]|uniref:C1q domain-containing protein n=1 Tax=Pinctada imbricata TaxID=66713 RepID=A0AA88XPK9_PINIB|nr:hypothetical protein FSP39_023963 [Pinctada imbricata]
MTTNTDRMSAHVTIRFDKVVTNLGGHYNPHSGNFVAPVTGYYVFYWQTTAYGKYKSYAILMVDGHNYGRSLTTGTEHHLHGAGNMAIVRVLKSQHVWIQTFTESSIHVGSSFSGYLLY